MTEHADQHLPGRPLPEIPGTTTSDEPFRLDPEAQAEVDKQLRDIDECRARALEGAATYIIH